MLMMVVLIRMFGIVQIGSNVSLRRKMMTITRNCECNNKVTVSMRRPLDDYEEPNITYTFEPRYCCKNYSKVLRNQLKQEEIGIYLDDCEER